MCTLPAEALQGDAPPSCFSFLLYGLFISHVFHISVLIVGMVTMAPSVVLKGHLALLSARRL